jgi:DNA-binding LacI/PurR family transcriptional regulator
MDGRLMVEKVTSIDVARLAGVSQSAVSRAFTPGASVSKKTLARVRAAAEQLGYRPNALARGLITGRSRIIGLVVAYLDNQFYPVAIEHLSRALQAKGYHILVFMAGSDNDNVAQVVQELLDYQIDGIVTASVSMSSELTDLCAAAGIPVVMFNRGQNGGGISSVTSDNRSGGRRVAEFLVAGGHERIAHVAGWEGTSTGRDRREGFVAGLAAAGRRPLDIIDGMYERAAASAAARTLMDRRDPPDAIFVGNDHMAFAVMDTLRFELGLSIPEDISIVGYDDVPLATWPSYELTTLRQPVVRMVDATIETLLAKIDDPERPPQKIEIEGPLVIRRSARIPEGWKR